MQATRNLTLWLTSLALVSGTALAGGEGQSCDTQKASQCSSQKASCSTETSKARTVAFAPLNAEQSAHVKALFAKVVSGEKLKVAKEASSCSSEGVTCEVTKKKLAKKAKYASCPINALAGELAASPAGWKVIEKDLHSAFTCDKACPDVKQRLTWLMGMKGCEVGHGVAADLYESAPQSFGDDHLIALAESGSKPAWKALMARWEADKLESAMPVALYAIHNKKVCDETTRILKSTVKTSDMAATSVNQALACALALEKHGAKEAITYARQKVHGQVLAALDSDELDTARDLALRAKYFHGASEWNAPMRLAFLDQEVAGFCKKMAGEFQTADQIFDLIESITPLD